MKNKKAVIAIIALIVLVAVALTCWFIFKPKAVEGAKTITVEITHKDGTTKTFTIHTDEEYLRGALEQENLVAGSESEFGLFVQTMDGETVNPDNQEWWGYTKSGAYVEYSVDQQPIHDGDHYEFTFNVGW